MPTIPQSLPIPPYFSSAPWMVANADASCWKSFGPGYVLALPDAELWLVADQNVNAPGVVSIHKPDDASLADLYRKAWVLCLPSTYEGFGIPYIEAMACGTPVVATPNDGARALLGDGRGLLAPLEDLGSALLSLLQDAPARQSIANLGLQRAGAFTQDRVVDAYESLFMSLVSASARPARARNLEP